MGKRNYIPYCYVGFTPFFRIEVKTLFLCITRIPYTCRPNHLVSFVQQQGWSLTLFLFPIFNPFAHTRRVCSPLTFARCVWVCYFSFQRPLLIGSDKLQFRSLLCLLEPVPNDNRSKSHIQTYFTILNPFLVDRLAPIALHWLTPLRSFETL